MKIRVFNIVYYSWFGTWVMNRNTNDKKNDYQADSITKYKKLFYVFGFGHLMDVSEKLKKKILITLIEKEIPLA